MDWNAVIERNREALKRILASLAAMAGLTIGQSPPLRGRCPAGQRGVDPEGAAGVTSPTLPRHRYRAVLRLLRPAEAAARRLIIVAARGMVVKLRPPRPCKPKPVDTAPMLRSLGLAVMASPADLARAAAASRAAAKRAARPRMLSLPLLDPLKNPLRPYRRTVAPHAAPRILSLDGPYRRLPPPPSPHDPIDATRLALRFQALASALDDLPGQARRFARWKARRDAGAHNGKTRDAGRVRRTWPLRPGLPPGQTLATRRRPPHEVHEVLADLQWFAVEVLERPDTS